MDLVIKFFKTFQKPPPLEKFLRTPLIWYNYKLGIMRGEFFIVVKSVWKKQTLRPSSFPPRRGLLEQKCSEVAYS